MPQAKKTAPPKTPEEAEKAIEALEANPGEKIAEALLQKGLKRIPKNGVVKAEDLPKIYDALAAYLFPEDARQTQTDSKFGQKNKSTGKLEVKGYRSQFIVNALNEIVGPGNWQEYPEKEEVEKGPSAWVTTYYGILEIGNWVEQTITKTTQHPDGRLESHQETVPRFQVLARIRHVGGSRNLDKWESVKGARTNFLKKACSMLGNGWRAYALVMDEDFESLPPEISKTVPEAKPTAAKNAGQQPSAPGEATATIITQKQAYRIGELLGLLGYSEEQIPDRIANIEKRMGKTLAEFSEGEARAIIKQMEGKLNETEEKKLQEALSPGEQQDRLASRAERNN